MSGLLEKTAAAGGWFKGSFLTNRGRCSGADSPLPLGEGAQSGVRAGMDGRQILPSPNPLPKGEGFAQLNGSPSDEN